MTVLIIQLVASHQNMRFLFFRSRSIESTLRRCAYMHSDSAWLSALYIHNGMIHKHMYAYGFL